MIQVAVTTGMRVAELTALRVADTHPGPAPTSSVTARDERSASHHWTVKPSAKRNLISHSTPDAFVFPTRDGTRMSHDAVTARLALHLVTATAACPTLTGKRISGFSPT